MRLGFTPDRAITEVVGLGEFTLSAEIIPPRNGAEQQSILDQIVSLKESGAEFLSVTKGAMGSLRGGSLPIAHAIKEQLKVPCIAHFTCRDLSAQDVENLLIDHHFLGIKNILALRGDPPDGEPNWKPKEGGYRYAHELITQIKNMNEGRFLPRAGGPQAIQEATQFCIGAAAYPEHPNEAERFEFFMQKAQAGAQYGITDMCFLDDAYGAFIDGLAKRGVRIPILPGARILRSQAQVDRMSQKFRVRISDQWRSKLPPTDKEAKTPLAEDLAIELFLEHVRRLKSRGAPGIHLFVIADSQGSKQALKALKSEHKKLA